MKSDEPEDVTDMTLVPELLVDWYDREGRELPWRVKGQDVADPYRVWLSEIMLQQTTVNAVIPYFEKFTAKWPRVEDLALAPEEELLAAWAGLGYYTRAHNLHKCAKLIVADYDGRFPDDEKTLLTLPGIGPYTAAAIAAIAFGHAATPMDGNFDRVIARLFAVETILPKAKKELKAHADGLTPEHRPGDYAQAMMDLGALICTPKRPSCLICPLERHCEGQARGIAARLPTRPAKADRPVRRGIAFLALREDGRVLLRKRAQTGLLSGMTEVPSTAWEDTWLDADEAMREVPVKGDWWPVPGIVTHTFTHFKLELLVYRAVVPVSSSLNLWAEPKRCSWVKRDALDGQALPSVMRKILAHGLSE